MGGIRKSTSCESTHDRIEMGVGSGHRRVHAASFKARHPACSVGAAKPLLPMNTRRDFLKTGLALGASAVILPSLVKAAGEQAAPSPATGAARPVLVAVKDGSRTAMLDKALAELGGVGRFVKKGQLVVLKPNIGWNATPERGANTHPELVGHMVTLCLAAGASRVVVFDKTCDKWTLTYKRSGIEDAVKAAGGEMMPGNDEAYYKEAAFPKGLVLKSGKVHRMVMEADVFINMPVLKHHSGSLMTSAMKNLMGVIWDRGFYHREDLHQCIADFVTFRAPDLNIVDAYHPMVQNGPRGTSVADVVEKRMLLASTDIVAVDTAAAKVLGTDPVKVTHLGMGEKLGLGTMNLERVDVRRLSVA